MLQKRYTTAAAPLRRHLPYIGPEEVRGILTEDLLNRTSQRWPLVSCEEIMLLSQNRKVKPIGSEIFHATQRYGREDYGKLKDPYEEPLFTGLDDKPTYSNITRALTNMFPGQLVAAGGFVRNQFGYVYNSRGDVDFFFVNCTKAAFLNIRAAAISHISSQYKSVKISRTEYVTTVSCSPHNCDEDYEYSLNDQYQFIHRIYPRMDMVIGGFDIAQGQFLYDGTTIYGTRLGVWSLLNQVEILNLSKRSTTFERRLLKYVERYSLRLIIPGTTDALIRHVSGGGVTSQMYNIFNDRLMVGKYWHIQEWFVGTPQGIKGCSVDGIENVVKEYTPTHNFDGSLEDANAKFAVHGISEHIASTSLELPVIPIDLSQLDHFRDDILKSFSPNHEVHLSRWKKWIPYNMRNEFRVILASEDPNMVQMFINGLKRRALNTLRRAQDCLEANQVITTNPTRQWTSSINPIVRDVRDWYGDHLYRSFKVGIPEEIETTLRISRAIKGSAFNCLPQDIFDHLLCHICSNYAQIGVSALYGDTDLSRVVVPRRATSVKVEEDTPESDTETIISSLIIQTGGDEDLLRGVLEALSKKLDK